MNTFLFFLGLVTVSAWIDHTDDHYLNYDPYPPFAQFLGWGIELFSVSIYSMATVNLKKIEELVTNTTAASKYIPRRPRISIN